MSRDSSRGDIDSVSPEMQHPAVNWDRTASLKGRAAVAVTCPACGRERLLVASRVRAALARGAFTGWCRRHAPQARQQAGRPPHPAVDWSSETRGERGARLVPIICPLCGERRLMESGEVARQLNSGQFVPYCLRDASSQPVVRPAHPAVEWVYDPLRRTIGGSRSPRLFAVVTCSTCGQRRRASAEYVSGAIKSNTFDPRCTIDREPLIGFIVERARANDGLIIRREIAEALVKEGRYPTFQEAERQVGLRFTRYRSYFERVGRGIYRLASTGADDEPGQSPISAK